MAEARGLFGYSSSDAPQKPKTQKTAKQRKKESNNITPVKRKRGTFEVERIAAQTHASIMRSCAHAFRNENGEVPLRCCPRHNTFDQTKVSPAKLWWAETTRYLTRLRRSLLKQKLVSNKPALLRIVQQDKISKDITNIDEILCRTERKKGANIPVFPKLRLSRCPVRMERELFPVYINSVELPCPDC